MSTEQPILKISNVDVFYGEKKALSNVAINVNRKRVTCFIGPSGCGKSTLLRSLNRMNDRIPGFRMNGQITLDGQDIYSRKMDLLHLRRTVGMVFQKPNPFPMSIYDNVAIGPRTHYGLKGRELDGLVEAALREAALWEEVKDELKKNALSLSGGQQQRLCIARMLAVRPEVILMDEPCSALDPISTSKIEELIVSLKQNHTLVVVTHNLQQAERISEDTAFFMFGELVEAGPSRQLFVEPSKQETQDYVSGRFG